MVPPAAAQVVVAAAVTACGVCAVAGYLSVVCMVCTNCIARPQSDEFVAQKLSSVFCGWWARV